MFFCALKALKKYSLNQPLTVSNGVLRGHIITRKVGPVLVREREISVCLFCALLNWFKSGGAWLEKCDVTYFHAPVEI